MNTDHGPGQTGGLANERTNQGRYCQERTPLQTFADGLQMYNQYVFDNELEEMAAA